MQDDHPSLYRKASTPGVRDLGEYADKVCGAMAGLNLTDNLSVLVSAIIAAIMTAQKGELKDDADTMVVQTVAAVLPQQYGQCRKQFGMTTDDTGEVYVMTSKVHPGYVRIDHAAKADAVLQEARGACPYEDNYAMHFIRRVPDPSVVVQRVREALHARNSPSATWYEIHESAAVALVRQHITIWFESPEHQSPVFPMHGMAVGSERTVRFLCDEPATDDTEETP